MGRGRDVGDETMGGRSQFSMLAPPTTTARDHLSLFFE
jgi:hypothetical protein